MQLYRGSSQQVWHVKRHIFATSANVSLVQFCGGLQCSNHDNFGERCSCALVRINSYIKIHSWLWKKFYVHFETNLQCLKGTKFTENSCSTKVSHFDCIFFSPNTNLQRSSFSFSQLVLVSSSQVAYEELTRHPIKIAVSMAKKLKVFLTITSCASQL